MIQISSLPKHILNDLHAAEYSDADIEQMTVAEAFDAYCVWHGIIGYSGQLLDALSSIIGAAEDHPLTGRHK